MQSDRIGRIADWNTSGSGTDDRATTVSGRGARSSRTQAPAYGAGAPVNTFAYFHGEDESSFSVVDNARSGTARRSAPQSLSLIHI